MTFNECKIELVDMILNYDAEISKWNGKGPDWWEDSITYEDHLRRTFITGIRDLIDHLDC